MATGIPAKCLACGKVLRIIDQATCAHCGSRSLAPLSFLSTSTVLAVILTVLAWELEAVVLGVELLAGHKVNWAGHSVLLATSGAMSLFAYSKGKAEIARVRKLGGRAAMNWFQAALVVLIILSFAALLMLFGAWQAGWR